LVQFVGKGLTCTAVFKHDEFVNLLVHLGHQGGQGLQAQETCFSGIDVQLEEGQFKKVRGGCQPGGCLPGFTLAVGIAQFKPAEIVAASRGGCEGVNALSQGWGSGHSRKAMGTEVNQSIEQRLEDGVGHLLDDPLQCDPPLMVGPRA
jgi:hypothetical protein